MLKMRKKTFYTYIIIFLACIWSFGDKVYSYSTNVYNQVLSQYKYQLSFPDTYSTTFISNKDSALEMAASADHDEDETVVKMAYLTFDDGPSTRTGEILDILMRNNIKATFFVVENDKQHTEYMQRAVMEGNAVGVHSASHKYSEIYKDVNSYLADFTACVKYIKDNTGIEPTIFRFPGGSVNNYNQNICRLLIEEMTRRGYAYFDWNVDSGDGTGKLSKQEIYDNVIAGCKGRKRAVIIMHDSIGKSTTVEALNDIINTLRDDGWQFDVLDNQVKPMVFKLK